MVSLTDNQKHQLNDAGFVLGLIASLGGIGTNDLGLIIMGLIVMAAMYFDRTRLIP